MIPITTPLLLRLDSEFGPGGVVMDLGQQSGGLCVRLLDYWIYDQGNDTYRITGKKPNDQHTVDFVGVLDILNEANR